MHHMFITPVIAGAVTAGVIALSPSFSDPYEASFASEEPAVARIELEIVAAIHAPAVARSPRVENLGQSFAPASMMTEVASLQVPQRETMTDMPFQRGDIVLAKAPIAEGVAIPVRADAPRLAVAAKRLNMRSGPGTTFKKMGVLGFGTELEQTGSAKGPWLEVAVVETGVVGWLHSDYLNELN